MQILNRLKRILASSVPRMRGFPTNNFTTNSFFRNGNKVQRTIIPDRPDAQNLRNLANNPIVCRPIISVQDKISSLSYEIKVKDGSKKQYKKQIRMIENIIKQPNLEHSKRAFETMLLQDLLVLGGAAFEIVKGGSPEHPFYLYPVDISTIKHLGPIDYTDQYKERYVQTVGDKQTYYTRDELCYLQRDSYTNTLYSSSPVRKAYDFIHFLLDGVDSSVDNVDNKTASMLINLGENAKEEDIQRFREYFANEIEGTSTTPIVGGSKGISTAQIKSLSGDVVYIEWLNWLSNVIAMAFPFPPQKLNIMKSTDRSTANDMDEIITEELVKPYARLLEDAYNKYIIGGLGLGDVLEFRYVYEDTEYTMKLKYARLNSAFKTGVITENEWRAALGYPLSTSKYANYTGDERKALINKDLGINGFNGVGSIKDTSDLTNDTKDDESSKGGEKRSGEREE